MSNNTFDRTAGSHAPRPVNVIVGLREGWPRSSGLGSEVLRPQVGQREAR